MADHGIDRTGASGGAGQASLIGSFADLTDPNADRIVFWDDSESIVTWLSLGDGLTLANTSLALSGTITQAMTFSGAITAASTLAVSGALTATTTLGVTGAATFSSAVTVEANLIVQDAGGTDKVTFSHDGADFNIAGTNTGNIRFTGASNLQARAGMTLMAFDATDTDYVKIYHDGARIFVEGQNADTLDYTGITTAIRIRDGIPLRIQDSTDTDYVQFSHDGTDFNIAGTNTTDINITGAELRIGLATPTTGSPLVNFTDGGITAVFGADSGAKTLTNATSKVARLGFPHYTNAEEEVCLALLDSSITTSTLRLGGGTANFNAITTGFGYAAANNTTTTGSIIFQWDIDSFDITNGTNLDVRDGGALLVRDAADTDYVTFSHDGTAFTLAGTNTVNFDFTNITTIRFRDGVALQILNSADTDYVTFSHDGTDFNIAGTNTTDINITGVVNLKLFDSGGTDAIQMFHNGTDGYFYGVNTAGFVFQNATNVWVQGANLLVTDSAWTDWVSFSHDGTDFNIAGTNTTDINITGVTAIDFSGSEILNNAAGGKNFSWANNAGTYTAGTAGGRILWHTDDSIYWDNWQDGSWWFRGSSSQNVVGIQGNGGGVRIYDNGGTDYATLSHDGTDFNIAGTNTTDINITGCTAITIPGQITFPASQSASANANTLDDYEEGTWTPIYSDGTSNCGMAVNNAGTYTKIGNTVVVQADARGSTSISSSSALMAITGLPFTPSAQSQGGMAVGYATNLNITAGHSVIGGINASVAQIPIFVFDAATGTTQITMNELSNDARILIGGPYLT